MKTPELTGEAASINASNDTIIDLASSALALSGVTLRTFAEAAADAETDFANGDSVPVFVRVDTTNWKRGTAVYDSATPKLTVTWTSVKGTIATGANVDVFVSLGEDRKPKNITDVAASTYNLLAIDEILHVSYTTTGAVAITYPTAQILAGVGRVIVVKDAGGNSSVNNITVGTEGAETIDGAATAVIAADYSSITLCCNGANLFII